MPARRYPLAPDHDRNDVFQLQGYHGRTATCHPPENTYAILTPLKATRPSLATWIEQPHAPSIQRITSSHLDVFEAVTHATGQPEVCFFIGPAPRFGNDVVNF
jgi:hypothetical protein